MSEGPESRDAENNWVIPNTEGLPVETVGAQAEPLLSQEEVKPAEGDLGTQPVSQGPEGPIGTQDVTEPPIPGPPADTPTPLEKLDLPPGEPESAGRDPGGRSRLGEDLEEVSCSSSEEDAEGLRKRLVRGSAPASVGPAPREAAQQDADDGSSLTLNRCIIAAVALVGVALLIFSGSGFSAEDDSPPSVLTRSVPEGGSVPAGIADIQEWIQEHADQFTGDPSSLQVMSGLLDRVAKENQDIRHMQAKLQAQREELEALLHSSSSEVTAEPPGVTEENVRLKDALLREETEHLSAREELQDLREKLAVLEAGGLEREALAGESARLKAELDASKLQIEGFLAQKETLVAESQMLRQELDKQRLLLASIRHDLEGLQGNRSEGPPDDPLLRRLSEVSGKLMLETQRSDTWEKRYVELAERRQRQTGADTRDWKTPANVSTESRKAHGRHGKRPAEETQRESQHEEWKSKDRKHRHQADAATKHAGERERDPRDSAHHHHHQADTAAKHAGETESWRDKNRDHKPRESGERERDPRDHKPRDSATPHHHHQEKGWKEKRGEQTSDYHPRKGQKEFSEWHKHEEQSEQRKTRGPEGHRHHDHNKFWKKLSDHQYRVPEGCSGLEDCARKDGLDLFNVALSPVQRTRFEEVLRSYLEKSRLAQHLPQLLPLLDGFFQGPLFSHHKIRFRDFVDDVEDFLEELARRETGSDDGVDDFERYVYTQFFGEAASRKRSH